MVDPVPPRNPLPKLRVLPAKYYTPHLPTGVNEPNWTHDNRTIKCSSYSNSIMTGSQTRFPSSPARIFQALRLEKQSSQTLATVTQRDGRANEFMLDASSSIRLNRFASTSPNNSSE